MRWLSRKIILFSLGISTIYLLYYTRQWFFSPHMPKLERVRSNVMTSDPYIIETTSLPWDDKFNPTVANGYIGHRIYSDTIYKNGLYNGEKGNSHRARIPGTLPYVDIEKSDFVPHENMRKNFGYSTRYILDMRHGTYSQIFQIESTKSEDVLCMISQKFYAHRYLTRILVTEIAVTFNINGSFELSLKSSSGHSSEDIEFTDFKNHVGNLEKKVLTTVCGHTITAEQPGMDVLPVCYVATKFPNKISLDTSTGKEYNFTFLTSIGNTADEVEKFYEIATEMIKKGRLLSTHQDEWKQTWVNGSISLTSGSMSQSSSVASALYYLLSAFPSNSVETYPYEFFGVSPGGLTNGGEGQDYWGHVFWDQDFWMLPGLLPLFPNAVRNALKYRIARLNEAVEKASHFGFKGAMFPWESAYTGKDVCPGGSYVRYEQHVTGDLIHTLKQYVYTTGNWAFLLDKIQAFSTSAHSERCHSAWDMVYETAKFWASRADWNNDRGKYSIREVMGPDEYHAPVDDSAFTNVVALQNLKFAIEAADVLNITIPEKMMFGKIANNIFIPYNKASDYHPEYDGYDFGKDTVKQADTIMLGFPLKANITPSSREHDLTIYGTTTDPEGPAMTWSMFAINWNALKKFSTADEYFLRQYANIQPPFQIWSEVTGGGGATNFLTGIGGYLQSIIYGYLNLRIYKDHITLAPRLPPGLDGEEVSKMVITGLKFNGVIFDVEVDSDGYSVTLAGFLGEDQFLASLRSPDVGHTLSIIGDGASFPKSVLCEVYIK